jgi:hypothetical protein
MTVKATGGNGMVEIRYAESDFAPAFSCSEVRWSPTTGNGASTSLGMTSLVIALTGRLGGLKFNPASPAQLPELKGELESVTETFANLKLPARTARFCRSSFHGCGFWLNFFLTSFTSFSKDVLSGNEQVEGDVVARADAFGGIGLGCMLCEKNVGESGRVVWCV